MRDVSGKRWIRAAGLGAVLGGVVALGLFETSAPASGGFAQGVSAGEISARSAKLWTRAPAEGGVRAVVATDRRLRDVIARKRKSALGSRDRTLGFQVRKLEPDTRHWFRFCQGGGVQRTCSPKGKFRTAPKPGKRKRVSFAFTGDTDGTPSAASAPLPLYGPFEAFKAMRKEGNDFNLHVGDT
ncbi:MAG: PhoD-like phosphatase N-terminal domain-containing protein, partial [Solirubrobacterales bacterium]